VRKITIALFCIAILLINSVSVSVHAFEDVGIHTHVIAVDPREVLTRYGCQGCHQVQGAGGTLGPSLDNVISDRGKAFFLRKVKEPQFNNASSAMPQMPITDEELEVLAEFLSPK
jgi:cytochrome c551/c552